MDVDPVPWAILLVALLAVAFAIAAETSMAMLNRTTVRKLHEDGNGRAKGLERLLQEPTHFLLTMLVLKTGGVLAAGAAVARLLPDTLDLASLLSVVVAAWLILALLQAAGRSWVQTRALAIALALAPLIQAAVLLLWPLTLLVRRVGRKTGELTQDEVLENALLSDNGLRRLIHAAEEEEPIEESEKQMIASILEMDETVAREVMVPRMDMVALSVETALRDALTVILDAGHSRIPVYEENIDRIVGFLYAKDLLKCFQANQGDAPIRTLLRPAYFVPVSKKVNTLLREMQHDRVHIAMVVDEYGGIAGLVTIEDILEEIVGEIQDEYDVHEEADVQVVEPGHYVVNARLDVYSLAKLLDTVLPDEDADTLGGMIYSELGHVPAPGEVVEVGGWRFTVLSLEGRRIEDVRAERIVETPADTAQRADAPGETEDAVVGEKPASPPVNGVHSPVGAKLSSSHERA